MARYYLATEDTNKKILTGGFNPNIEEQDSYLYLPVVKDEPLEIKVKSISNSVFNDGSVICNSPIISLQSDSKDVIGKFDHYIVQGTYDNIELKSIYIANDEDNRNFLKPFKHEDGTIGFISYGNKQGILTIYSLNKDNGKLNQVKTLNLSSLLTVNSISDFEIQENKNTPVTMDNLFGISMTKDKELFTLTNGANPKYNKNVLMSERGGSIVPITKTASENIYQVCLEDDMYFVKVNNNTGDISLDPPSKPLSPTILKVASPYILTSDISNPGKNNSMGIIFQYDDISKITYLSLYDIPDDFNYSTSKAEEIYNKQPLYTEPIDISIFESLSYFYSQSNRVYKEDGTIIFYFIDDYSHRAFGIEVPPKDLIKNKTKKPRLLYVSTEQFRPDAYIIPLNKNDETKLVAVHRRGNAFMWLEAPPYDSEMISKNGTYKKESVIK